MILQIGLYLLFIFLITLLIYREKVQIIVGINNTPVEPRFKVDR